MPFFRQIYITLAVVGICIVTGCQSGAKKARANTDDFICFQDISDYSDPPPRNPPLAVCVDNPNRYLEERAVPTVSYRISKYLVFGDSNFLMLLKVPRDDFREIETPVSDFVSNAVDHVDAQEYGAVNVTIVVGSKVQSKNLGRRDYKLLLNQIPANVLQRHPDLANELRYFEKEPPLRLDALQPKLNIYP